MTPEAISYGRRKGRIFEFRFPNEACDHQLDAKHKTDCGKKVEPHRVQTHLSNFAANTRLVYTRHTSVTSTDPFARTPIAERLPTHRFAHLSNSRARIVLSEARCILYNSLIGKAEFLHCTSYREELPGKPTVSRAREVWHVCFFAVQVKVFRFGRSTLLTLSGLSIST